MDGTPLQIKVFMVMHEGLYYLNTLIDQQFLNH